MVISYGRYPKYGSDGGGWRCAVSYSVGVQEILLGKDFKRSPAKTEIRPAHQVGEAIAKRDEGPRCPLQHIKKFADEPITMLCCGH
jgi:hypothetical protein